MNIKNKLYVSAGISIILVAILASLVLVMSGKVTKGNQRSELFDSVRRGISELDTLTYDYLLHHEERMEQQWRLRHDSLGEILQKIEDDEIKSIRAGYGSLGDLFSQVTANYKEYRKLLQEGASSERIDTVARREELLGDQLLITSQSASTESYVLAEKAQAEAINAQRLATNLTLVLMIILASSVTTLSLLVARSISKPLDELTKGARKIGEGDLEHRVIVRTKDELGRLAMAFNEMTKSLKEVTASRDELEREINLRKQAEASVRRLAAIVESSDDAIIGKTLAGTIISWNQGAQRLYGYSADEVMDKSISLLVPPDTPDEIPQILDRIARGETTEQFETVRVGKDGRRIDVSLSVSPIKDSSGQIVGASTIARDVTERKRSEAEIRKLNTELTAANKELEAFSYSVSHDLRAPLRSIDGFSQAVLEDYADKLDSQGKNFLSRVRAGAQRMGELIDDLLTLSRVTRYDMSRSDVNLSTIAQSIAAELKKAQPERQAEFTISEGLTVNGDERLLKVMLTNLLDNAWKFTGKQPSARIEFGVNRYEGKLAYFVRDNGAGFDMAYANKLFTPFQRLHSADEFPGTGIGLATVQRIIHRHGGRVWAQGAIGKGAIFYFMLDQSIEGGQDG